MILEDFRDVSGYSRVVRRFHGRSMGSQGISKAF